jgi:hypothetical protein
MEKLFNRVNEVYGISAFVILGKSGKFHAIYRDDDSGNNITIVICPTLEMAIEKCKEFF